MTEKRKMVVTIGASLLAGGAMGLALFGPSLAGAATGTTNPPPATAPSASGASGGFHSNEDPAHEAAESPEREAEENSGKAFHGGGGHHGFNEDPAHEATESPEREAQEDAANGASGGGAAGSSSSDGTLQ